MVYLWCFIHLRSIEMVENFLHKPFQSELARDSSCTSQGLVPSFSVKAPSKISLFTADWDQYELLDSGGGRRLERIGEVIVDRPEPKAWWDRSASEEVWKSAVATFDVDSGWRSPARVGKSAQGYRWELSYGPARFFARLSSNKHLGVFPEQAAMWGWIRDRLSQGGMAQPRVLNLFGYTGIASLVAAHAGGLVTHLDGSKPAVSQGRENIDELDQEHLSIRWIVDDVRAFVARELRRGNRYEGIILDPPSFGRGPRQEVWKSSEQLPALLKECAKLLSEKALFMVATVYSIEASATMVGNLLLDAVGDKGGAIEAGEIAMIPTYGGKPLSVSLVGRWSAGNGWEDR